MTDAELLRRLAMEVESGRARIEIHNGTSRESYELPDAVERRLVINIRWETPE